MHTAQVKAIGARFKPYINPPVVCDLVISCTLHRVPHLRTHFIFDFLNNNYMKISDYMHFMTPEHYIKTRLSYPELRYDVVNGIIICAKHR